LKLLVIWRVSEDLAARPQCMRSVTACSRPAGVQ